MSVKRRSLKRKKALQRLRKHARREQDQAKPKRQRRRQKGGAERPGSSRWKAFRLQDREGCLVEDSPDQLKMSDVLTQLVEDMSGQDILEMSPEEFEKSLGLVVLLWNLSLLEEDVREEQLARVHRQCVADGVDISDELRAMVSFVEKWREVFYPDCRRVVFDFAVTPVEDGNHVVVASSLG